MEYFRIQEKKTKLYLLTNFIKIKINVTIWRTLVYFSNSVKRKSPEKIHKDFKLKLTIQSYYQFREKIFLMKSRLMK